MSRYFPDKDECGQHMIFHGVRIRTCAGDNMSLSLADLEAGAVVDDHSHPHEQIGMVIEGEAIFSIGDEQKTLRAGDFYYIPGNVRHRVVALDQPVRALDIFYPIREEYR